MKVFLETSTGAFCNQNDQLNEMRRTNASCRIIMF